MLKLFWHELGRMRGAIIGWGTGLSIFAWMYIALYPALADQMAAIDLSNIPIYQALGNISMGTLELYIASTILNFLAMIVGIYAIIAGTGALAGEEDQGTLEILVTLPLGRGQIVAAKGLALATAALVVLSIAGLAAGATILSIKGQVETELTLMNLFIAVLNAYPITLFFTMLGFWLGTLMPSRRIAAIITTVVFIASYFGKNLSNMIDMLEPFKPIFPFTYYDSSSKVLVDGIVMDDALILLSAAAVCFFLAWVCFRVRNITTGAWFFIPNQKPAK